MKTRNFVTLALLKKQALTWTWCMAIQLVLVSVLLFRGEHVGYCAGMAFGSACNATSWWLTWYGENRFGEGKRKREEREEAEELPDLGHGQAQKQRIAELARDRSN